MLETKSLAQRLHDHLKSPEGKLSMENYFNKIKIRNTIERTRAYRVKEHFTDETSFNTLMQFVLERQNKYDARHYTTYSERSLHIINLIWELASNEGQEIDAIDKLTEGFPSMVYEYFGWQFAISHGQGSVLSIYKNRELMYRSN
jgi:hypothetical protein